MKKIINDNTKVFGIYKSEMENNYRPVAMNCFFVNYVDALEVMENLRNMNRKAIYSTKISTFGTVFDGKTLYSGEKPVLYKNANVFYACFCGDEKQI